MLCFCRAQIVKDKSPTAARMGRLLCFVAGIVNPKDEIGPVAVLLAEITYAAKARFDDKWSARIKLTFLSTKSSLFCLEYQ